MLKLARHRWTLVIAVCAFAGCGAAPNPGWQRAQETDRSAEAEREPCRPGAEPLTLSDGTEVYIEPENLIALDEGLLVAGSPTYTWRTAAAGPAVLVSRDAHLAVVVEPAGVELVDKPVDLPIGDVRVASLDGHRWAAVFSEVGVDSLPVEQRMRAVWYAEHDGARWGEVGPLPAPAAGYLDFASSSALVRTARGVAWAVVARAPGSAGGVRVYERTPSAWRVSEIPGEASDAVETTALTADDGGDLWLALVGPDVELPGDPKSVRARRRSDGWRAVTRAWIAPSGVEIYDPRIGALPSGVTVSWRALEPEAATGMARVGIGPTDPGTEILVDANAMQLVPAPGADATPTWIVDHLDPVTQRSELRLARLSSSGVLEVAPLTSNPYTGFFGASWVTPTELAVVGPEFDPDPTRPTVRSLLLRLSTTCT